MITNFSNKRFIVIENHFGDGISLKYKKIYTFNSILSPEYVDKPNYYITDSSGKTIKMYNKQLWIIDDTHINDKLIKCGLIRLMNGIDRASLILK